MTTGSSDISNGFDFETSDAVFSEDKVDDDDPVKDNDADKEESTDGNVTHLIFIRDH